MGLDSLHGAIFVLVLLSVVNSIAIIAITMTVLFQVRQLSQLCDALKNWLVVQSRKSHKTD